jgi:hypothetical protein
MQAILPQLVVVEGLRNSTVVTADFDEDGWPYIVRLAPPQRLSLRNAQPPLVAVVV